MIEKRDIRYYQLKQSNRMEFNSELEIFISKSITGATMTMYKLRNKKKKKKKHASLRANCSFGCLRLSICLCDRHRRHRRRCRRRRRQLSLSVARLRDSSQDVCRGVIPTIRTGVSESGMCLYHASISLVS